MAPKYRPPNRGRRSTPKTLSAPTGGLNGRDSFTDMDPLDAFQLDNWFPSSTSVDTRAGSRDWTNDLPGAVESLETYTGGTPKMLAFSDGKIYDVSADGVLGAALKSGRTSNKATSCMFSNAGAQFLLAYTGEDPPVSYDGTTVTNLAITGLNGGTTQNEIHSGHAFKGRMLLAQTGQLGFYYLGIGTIQGAASYFDLSQQCANGGSVAAITSVSQDSGKGPQDLALFVTTEGEYVLYEGTDPSNAATWALVGRYYGPRPIGKKSWFKFRSEVFFITEEGILSFAQIKQIGDDNENQNYLTSKLGRHFTDETATHQNVFGWSGMIYPRGNMLLANVPLTGSTTGAYAQFVMNTNTNKWCRFLGWDGLCWALLNRRLYFGTTDGRVVLADDGFTDSGAAVVAVARTAWNTYDDGDGMGEADKQYHFAAFAMQAEGAPAIACTLNVNYEDDRPTPVSLATSPDGATWDVADWDDEYWAGTPDTQNLTVSVGKLGYIASIWMQATSVAAKIRWFASRIVFEKSKGVIL